MSQSSQQSFTATYTSPENAPFQISQHLDISSASSSSSPSSSSSSDLSPEEIKQQRVQYLSQLRKAASTVQASVNKELTARMEQDKIREAETAAQSGAVSKKKKAMIVDEEAEEQNYGEEVVEDSD